MKLRVAFVEAEITFVLLWLPRRLDGDGAAILQLVFLVGSVIQRICQPSWLRISCIDVVSLLVVGGAHVSG